MADPSIKDLAYRGLAATLGGPVDLATMVMRPFGYSTPDQQVVGGSEWIGKKMEDVGLVSTARSPVQEFAAGLVFPGPDDLYRAAAMAPALVGAVRGVGKVDDALRATTKADDFAAVKIDEIPRHIAKAKGLGISKTATPVKNYEKSISEIDMLSAPDIAFTRSNSRATGYFHRNGEVVKTINAMDLGLDRVPSPREDVLNILRNNVDSRFDAELSDFAIKKQRAIDTKKSKEIVKNDSLALDEFMSANSDMIKNFHKQTELEFIPVSDNVFNQKQAKFIYQSPSYGKKAGSSYKLVMVDGRPAYARQSDHWGKFSSRSADDFDKWNDYNWTLPGAEPGKRSTGIVFLD